MSEKSRFPCRNQGCTMEYTTDSNRLRHEKRCTAHTPSVSVGDSGDKCNTIVGDGNTIDQSTHVNVTLHINAFDTFRPSEIDQKRFVDLMTQGATNVILKCLEEQQFNIDKPENMNVFISNMKDRIARVFDGYCWKARRGDDVVDHVLETYTDMLNESVDGFSDTENPNVAKKITRWKKNTEKEEFEAHAKSEILYQLYNLRHLVKDTHNVKQR